MKVVAMYLPQFHNVKENDEWWGEGYTEWVAVREANSYYEGHKQPKVPLNNNYYNLLEKETMQWQADLMHQYGIDGICMYHYWFKDGKKMLEKPAENLLEWTDIDIPFCFYWDSQSWIRSWSKREKGNVWASRLEPQKEKNGPEVLLEQDFGEELQWKEHFEYLLPFFMDKRYILIDNRPVFMIYQIAKVDCIKEMVEKWNDWAREAGFNGIYLIGTLGNAYTRKVANATLMHEPTNVHARTSPSDDRGIKTYSYDEDWQAVLDYERKKKKTFYGGFVGFDDTPRRGCNGYVIEGQSPEKFEGYFSQLLAKNEVAGNEITFLNAWNEWGEGMYLEPDSENGYAYLEAVLQAKNNYKQYISQYEEYEKESVKKILEQVDALEMRNERHRYVNSILNQWLDLEEQDRGLDQYFVDNNIKNIAVYGLGILGRKMINELKNTNIKVVFGIDRMKNKEIKDIPIYSQEDNLPDVDVIVLTMADGYYFKKKIEKLVHTKVVTLDEVLSSLR